MFKKLKFVGHKGETMTATWSNKDDCVIYKNNGRKNTLKEFCKNMFFVWLLQVKTRLPQKLIFLNQICKKKVIFTEPPRLKSSLRVFNKLGEMNCKRLIWTVNNCNNKSTEHGIFSSLQALLVLFITHKLCTKVYFVLAVGS